MARTGRRGPSLRPGRLSEPNAGDLVPRLFQAVGMLASLVAEGQQADHRSGELRALVQLKSDFLRLTTHELRRPLGLLSGYLSLIQEGTYGPVPEALRAGLRQIGAGTEEMANLLEGLAMIARIEDGADALRRQPNRLGHLVAEAVHAVEIESTAKGITIDEQLPEPDILTAVDRDRLRTAVINLLGNAIKYAPERSVVSVVVGERDDALTIAVADQGPGIDPGESARIFDRWHRSSGSGATGLGLGLYIVRLVVELHGGRVELESQLGRGSTFTVVLPR